jgi:leucyl aminopeptidase
MLQIDWGHELPTTKSDSLLVVAITKDDIEGLDQRFGPGVSAAVSTASFEGNAGDSFRFSVSAPEFQQVVLLGAGDLDGAASLRRLGFDAGRAARGIGVAKLVLDVRGRLDADDERTAKQIAEGLELSGYAYEHYLGEDRRKPAKLEAVTVVALGDTTARRAGTQRGQIIAAAIRRARDLGNGPAELVTPTFLAESAGELAAELRGAGHDVSCEVFDVEECERRSMGLFLAVARGSSEPAKFIHMTYKPKRESKGRICLIGKGVTFDSGGYSIKPTDGMLQMKLDMGGAAAVIGAMEGIARRPRRTWSAATLIGSAMCSAPRTARPSRSTTPTPRVA